jgi:predicted CXXCH cytochrome family protein
MRSLIRRRMPDGSRQEQVLESIALTFGRATDNTIELPGLPVAPRHAKLSFTVPGRYLIESGAVGGLEINGTPGIHEQELVPGNRVKIGDHSVTIGEPAEGFDLVIEVQLAAPERVVARAAEPAVARADARTTLRATGLSYRRPAWILAVIVLLVAIVLPLASTSLSGLWPGMLPSYRLWTSGRISGGHSHFGDECGTCHEALFQRVRDDACLSCHTGTRHHSDDPAIRTVAGFDDVRCASCHREHDAVNGLDPPHPDLCTDCHAAPKFAAFPDLGPASDFGTDHPEFRPQVSARLADGAVRAERQAQTADLKDRHGLVFNHALHLDAAGVRAPDGQRVLACADCHTPDASRMGFRPFRYATHCAGCHALDAQIAGNPVTLPHGSNELLRELLDKYARQGPAAPAAPPPADTEVRRRPGEGADRGSDGGFTDEVRRTAFRLCAKCHEMQTASATGAPTTRPLTLTQSWLTHARFTHAEHEAMECTRCHAAARSQFADELLLPALGDCRTCHAGVDSSRGVSSTCIDCHRLHQARQPWIADVRRGERVSGRREEQEE